MNTNPLRHILFLVTAVVFLIPAQVSVGQISSNLDANVQGYFTGSSDTNQFSNPNGLTPWSAAGSGTYPSTGVNNVPAPPSSPLYPVLLLPSNSFSGSSTCDFNDGTVIGASGIDPQYHSGGTYVSDGTVQAQLILINPTTSYAYEQLDFESDYYANGAMGGVNSAAQPNFQAFGNITGTNAYAQVAAQFDYWWALTDSSPSHPVLGSWVHLGTLDYNWSINNGVNPGNSPFDLLVSPLNTSSLFTLGSTPSGLGILAVTGEMFVAGDPANITVKSVSGLPTWTGGGDGYWSTGSDWSYAPRNGYDLIFAGSSQPNSTNDSLTSAGSITFDSTAVPFTLSGNALTISGGITNNSSSTQTIGLNLTLSSDQEFNAASGALSVSGTISNGGNLLTVAGSSNTSLFGGISGLGGLTKSDAGILNLSGNNSYSGGTSVNGGTLNVGHVNALGTGGLSINNGAITRVNTGASAIALSSLSIDGGSATPTSTLDIASSKVVVNHATLSAAQATHTTVQQQVRNSYNNFSWDQAGITSSTVQNDVNNIGNLTAVGYALNDDGGGNFYEDFNGTNVFGGKVTDSNSVLIRYTYLADLDLNGLVDGQDYTLFTVGYLGGAPYGADWAWGDMDYNNTIDSNDFSLFSAGYLSNSGLPAIASPAAVQPVPEPSTILLAGWGLVSLGVLRRRRA